MGGSRSDSADAAERAGARRFVQISSMGAGQPPQPGADEVWAACITAKTAAEADLRFWDLDWTIVRPGALTDAPPTGRIRLAPPPAPRGTIPAPTSPRSTLPCSTSRVPGTRHSS